MMLEQSEKKKKKKESPPLPHSIHEHELEMQKAQSPVLFCSFFALGFFCLFVWLVLFCFVFDGTRGIWKFPGRDRIQVAAVTYATAAAMLDP